MPVTDAGEIVLVRQYRHAIGRFAWELPAGSLKPAEDVAAAAGRECQEETGLVSSRLTPLGSFFPTPGYCDEQMNFFRADGLREPTADEIAQPDEDEEIEARAFSREAIRRMIADGDIIDLKTVAGLALLDRAAKTDYLLDGRLHAAVPCVRSPGAFCAGRSASSSTSSTVWT